VGALVAASAGFAVPVWVSFLLRDVKFRKIRIGMRVGVVLGGEMLKALLDKGYN
jgi:hypothetical protein